MPTPPFFGLTQLLTLLKQIQLDPNQMNEAEQRRDEVQPEDLRTDYLGATGWGPRRGERLSQFWERSTPGVFPPNWTEHRGSDLQLPPENQGRKAAKSAPVKGPDQPTNAELKQLIVDLYGQSEFFNNPKGDAPTYAPPTQPATPGVINAIVGDTSNEESPLDFYLRKRSVSHDLNAGALPGDIIGRMFGSMGDVPLPSEKKKRR